MRPLSRIHSFLESSLIDWDGKIATVVFLSGCNLKCPWCHNHSLIREVSNYNEEDVFSFLEKKKNWIDGVVLCGGEPLLKEDVVGFIKRIKKSGFSVKVDTNGTNPFLLKKLIDEGIIDYVAMDIKARLTEEKYKIATGGIENILSKILESINVLVKSNMEFEFRTTFVPEIVKDEDILFNLNFIPEGTKYIMQKFSPDNVCEEKFKNMKNYEEEELKSIVKMLEEKRRVSWLRV